MSNPLNGWLIIDKPLGISSANVVSLVKNTLGANKAGHAGTLDPLASGILPVAIGEATKTVNYLTNSDKEYIFTIKFGEQRATNDAEGLVTNYSDKRPNKIELIKSLELFQGSILQQPPNYSAIKINGTPAYRLARAGKVFSISPRQVFIKNIKLLELDDEQLINEATIQVLVSKGTYIRTLANDIAIKLDTYGYVSKLRRTAVRNFSFKDAILLDNIKELVHNRLLKKKLLAVDIALDDIPAIKISDQQTVLLRYGQAIEVDKNYLSSNFLFNDQFKAINNDQQLVAIGFIKLGYFKPQRVFNY